MTLVVCPNLAVDRLLSVDAVRPGETMRCRLEGQQAGGKGPNVVRALSALNGTAEGAALLGFVAGHQGRLFELLAAEEHLALEATELAHGETRVSMVVLDLRGGVTRICEHGPAIAGDDAARLVAAVRAHSPNGEEWALVTGAALPGAAAGFYAELIRALRDVGYRVMLDAAGEQLAAGLREHPDLAKVNLAEACSAFGEPDDVCVDERQAPDGELALEGLALCRRMVAAGAHDAIITLGRAGAVGLVAGQEWRVSTPPVRAVNPVGCGDCFTAGLLTAFARGDDDRAALALAAGAGAANAVSLHTADVDSALAAELAGGASVGPPLPE